MISNLAAQAAFFKRVFHYFRPDLPKVILLIAVICSGALLGLAQVWPLAILVDVVLVPDADAHFAQRLLGWLDSAPGQIVALAAAALLLRLFQEALSMARSVLHVSVAHQGIMRVRCDLFRKLQALSVDFHRSQPQGDTIYRLMQDAPGCEQILTVWIEVLVAALTLVAMLGVMFSRSAEMSLVGLAVAPLLVIVNRAFATRLKRENVVARTAESQLTSVVQRNMASITLVQAFRREPCEYRRFSEAAGSSASAWLRVQRQMAVYRLCVGAIFGSGAAAIFAYGGHAVSQGQMSVGDLMIFLTYLAMFYDPLCKISASGATIQQGVAGMRRVLELLDRDVAVSSRPGAVEFACQPRTLELRDVSFSYLSDRKILDRVSATIEPGQSVAFVGSSGVGKSTLLSLLPRLFDPTDGVVMMDGVDVREVKLADLRRHVALVLQESPLLPASVRENIAYGRPDASDEQIRRAAELVGADRFIGQMPQGYETSVAEAGQNLSGGQRQRIALARALLTEAPIIVLDEPTSALDPSNEQQFVTTLRSLQGERTIVLVSHRLSTVQHCDQIFVMDQGRVVEQGTHQELLGLRGHYWRMADAQLSASAHAPGSWQTDGSLSAV